MSMRSQRWSGVASSLAQIALNMLGVGRPQACLSSIHLVLVLAALEDRVHGLESQGRA